MTEPNNRARWIPILSASSLVLAVGLVVVFAVHASRVSQRDAAIAELQRKLDSATGELVATSCDDPQDLAA